jgi:hypothetical protein
VHRVDAGRCRVRQLSGGHWQILRDGMPTIDLQQLDGDHWRACAT